MIDFTDIMINGTWHVIDEIRQVIEIDVSRTQKDRLQCSCFHHLTVVDFPQSLNETATSSVKHQFYLSIA